MIEMDDRLTVDGGPDEAGARLDKFLAEPTGSDRAAVRRALERGKVFVNDVEAVAADAARRLAAGDRSGVDGLTGQRTPRRRVSASGEPADLSTKTTR